ncbi:DUF2809 domain-containing protein [Sinorhizobium sp. A49]|uniref:ribosomal maturation YjgA family protein n=1 Tax=Sinorhizobium sp. A49 TaxID=1945861 RepID=UPI001FDA8299|nr:DUF2809 domain-containing protein [Sinorhizobium sp. A49]
MLLAMVSIALLRRSTGRSRPVTSLAMQLHFDRTAFVFSILLLVILVLLATLGASWGWVRGFSGDVLAVIWVYCTLGSIVKARPQLLASVAFLLGVTIELAQYLAAMLDIRIANSILRIVIGATPDWWDVLAYGLGAVVVLGLATLKRFWPRRSITAVNL